MGDFLQIFRVARCAPVIILGTKYLGVMGKGPQNLHFLGVGEG